MPAVTPDQGASGAAGNDTSVDEEMPTGVKYMGPLVAILSLFLVLCGFAALYIYHYHGGRIKALMRWNRDKNQKMAAHAAEVSAPSFSEPISPPVPPPRTKRISHQIRDIEAEESSVLTGSTKPSVLMPKLTPASNVDSGNPIRKD